MATYLGRFQSLARTASEWNLDNPTLMRGEVGVADPDGSAPTLKVGDGARAWSALPAIVGGSGGGAGPDYVVGTTTTLAPGSFATVTINNVPDPPTISFGIPRGDVGPANALAIGTVTTGAPGSAASASIFGTPPSQTLNLTIPAGANGAPGAAGADGMTGPPGATGPANVLTIGTVTTGAAGAPADASITGTSPAQVLNLTIPTGAVGPAGPTGPTGPSGPAGSTTLADPTGVIGLTAVNGSSAFAIRSDGSPPLSQAITPSWTGLHSFTSTAGAAGASLQIVTAAPTLVLWDMSQAADSRAWYTQASAANYSLGIMDDGVSVVKAALKIARAGTAVASLSFGNATDNPAYSFLGIGAATFNGTVNLLGPLLASSLAGVPGQVLATQGAGLPPEWRTSSGGSIELGYNFSTAVGTANPGSQKMSLNSAVYSTVTVAVFNSLAMTNFDASTILSLLTTGNRIYIQQRNDASKAVVYEVTGPGTNNTGYWTIPVSIIQSRGAMFAANADLNCVFILSVSASSLANPTTAIGLTTVNGSATTGMRSDAAPPLSQAIVPTWSGKHTFTFDYVAGSSAVDIACSVPILTFTETDAAANAKRWLQSVNASQANFYAASDNDSTLARWLQVVRTLATITSLSFGNTTDNPTYTFAGTGQTNHGGPVAVTGAVSASVFRADGGLTNGGGTLQLLPNTGALTYGTYYVNGAVGTYHGIAVNDGTLNPTLMSSGVASGIYLQGEAKWLLFRSDASNAISQYAMNAVAFYSASASGGNMGAGTVNATAYYVNGAALTAGPSPADPTATANIFAVAGVATTYLRSDSAPALSQAIAPTWSATHKFGKVPTTSVDGAMLLQSSTPLIGLWETGAASSNKIWDVVLASGILRIRTADDLGINNKNALTITRSNNNVANLSFGNITDNPTFSFLGTGVATISGALVMGTASGGSQGTGTVNAQGLYVNGVAVSTSAGAAGANPSASIGLTAVNGSAGTFMRSDAAPALSTAIVPTWSQLHTFAAGLVTSVADSTIAAEFKNTSGRLRVYGYSSGSAYIQALDAAGGTAIPLTITASSSSFSGSASATSFTTTSGRATKRETGAPRYAADVLARLRPILYRLLAGSDREQLGLIAEEVQDVCPLLSDGITVAYDRLALLLLADWQDRHAVAA